MSKYSIKKLCSDKQLMQKIFPRSPLSFQTLNPQNNKLIKSFNFDNSEKTEKLLERAFLAYQTIKDQTIDDQFSKLHNFKSVLSKHKEEFAQLICLEMGKPINECRIEVDRTWTIVDYYIEHSRYFLDQKTLPDFGTYKNYLIHEPIGPILHITPWNLPLAVPLKSIIPCLVARNPCILKPAPNVPQTSLLLQKCFEESGFRDYEFQLSFSEIECIDRLIGDPRMRYVIFTGSTNAGKVIGELSGRSVKRCLLELGGSDPMIVLKDADIDKTVDLVVSGRIRANGQTCTSTKRVILDSSMYDEFKVKLEKKLGELKIGDPSLESTKIGPLARFDLFMNLNNQLKDYIDDYDYEPSMGNYFKPVVIDNPSKDSSAYNQELFGPTITLFKRNTIDEMIETANDTIYGLSAACISKDENLAQEVIKRVDCGMAFVNTPYVTHPSIPFGGNKSSGFGRANSFYIFNEVTNMKTITINRNH